MHSTKYRNITQPWVVIAPLQNAKTEVIRRFQRRNVAEGYVSAMRQLRPDLRLEIVWFQALKED